tara:strand:- start:12948 stop:13256 length:309 start_codon:yes stop_codon:yes gene_type:complete
VAISNKPKIKIIHSPAFPRAISLYRTFFAEYPHGYLRLDIRTFLASFSFSERFVLSKVPSNSWLPKVSFLTLLKCEFLQKRDQTTTRKKFLHIQDKDGHSAA